MNPNVKLEKIRSVTDEDLILIMGPVHQDRHTRPHTRHLQNRENPTAQSERSSNRLREQKQVTVSVTSSLQTQC